MDHEVCLFCFLKHTSPLNVRGGGKTWESDVCWLSCLWHGLADSKVARLSAEVKWNIALLWRHALVRWVSMDIQSIVDSLDQEIARLQQARSILSSIPSVTSSRGPGRPKSMPIAIKGKRIMSAEGKARIAEAQKKRWAEKNRGKA